MIKKAAAYLLTLTVLCSALSLPMLAAPRTESGSSGQSSPESSAGSSSEPKEKDGGSSAASSQDASGRPTAPPSDSSSPALMLRPPNEEELMSKGIYLLNLDSGDAVFERNAQDRMPPAYLTQVMTAIVALESDIDLDQETTSLKTYIQSYLYNLQVQSLGGIGLGEELSIRDLLYAMMLQSANEAAMMVADYVGDGSIDYFCELMNKKAREIGAKNTHFANPTGLHLEGEENYTTPYDMAMIAKYAMQNPDFVDLVTARTYTSAPTSRNANGITWYSNNLMMSPSDTDYYYEGSKGIKSGTLEGQNVRNSVSMATRDGYSYICVALGAPYHDADGLRYKYNLAWRDTMKLFDWAFETFSVKTLMNVGDEVYEVNVRLSWDTDHIKLLAADKFASLVAKEVTSDDIEPEVVIENCIELPIKGAKDKTAKYIDAPIKKGEEVGYVKLMLSGQEVGRVKLVAGETVAQSKALFYLEKVKSFFDTLLFKFVFTLAVIILALYIVLMVIRNRNRRRYKARRRRPPQKRK